MTTSAGPTASPSDSSTDRLAERFIAGPATILVGLVCLLQLGTWLPHYLTWPLWAITTPSPRWAKGWTVGRLPYRDLPCNQFPGAVYLYWMLGRLAGWGHSASLHAFDAATILALGLALVLWSKRVFGASLPGWVGYLSFLSFYLSLDYSLAAQRDWHAPFFAILGILIFQTWEGRTAAPAFSAAAVATALLIRPHAIFFLPAVAMQLVVEMRTGRGARRTAVWIVSFLLMILLGFTPLAINGLLPDFLAGIASNNPSARHGIGRLAAMVVGLFNQLNTLCLHRRRGSDRPAAERRPEARLGGRRLGRGVPHGAVLQADPSAESCLPRDPARGGVRGERRRADSPRAVRPARPGFVPAPLPAAGARGQLQDEARVLQRPIEPLGGIRRDPGPHGGERPAGIPARSGPRLGVLRLGRLPRDPGLPAPAPRRGRRRSPTP